MGWSKDRVLHNMADKPKKWIQAAVSKMKEKGTVGSFSRAAKKAGMSTQSFARKEKKSGSPSMAKKANFALNVAKSKH